MLRNPFVNRGMIRSDNKFWGRAGEINTIYSLLFDSEEEAQSIAILGLRRIGKSSLLYRITQKRGASEMYDDQLKQTVCTMMSMQSLSSASSEEFYQALISEFATNKIVEELGILASILNNGDKPSQQFTRFLRQMDRKGYLTVILLDEFECAALNPNFDRHFFDQLRSFAQQWRISYIVAAQQDLSELWEPSLVSSPYSSPFFNFFQTVHLVGFPIGRTQDYLEYALNGTGLSFCKEDIGLVEEVGGNHPFFVNIVAYHLFSALVSANGQKVMNYEELRHEITQDPTINGNFAYYWKILTSERRLLLRLLYSGLSAPFSPNVIGDINWLKRMGIIHAGEEGQLIPFSNAFGEFVKQSDTSGLPEVSQISIELMPLEELIAQDEGTTFELKSTLRWDLRENKVADYIETEVIKTIAAFLNTDGGTLIIGVSDSNEVVGLKNDYQSLKKKGRDGFELHLTNLVSQQLGKTICQYIRSNFHEIEGNDICVIAVAPSMDPVFVGKDEIFYVRTLNSTQKLSPKEMHVYSKKRWANGSTVSL